MPRTNYFWLFFGNCLISRRVLNFILPSAICLKMQVGIFFTKYNSPKMCMEPQTTQNSQSSFQKEGQSWRHHTPCFQTVLQSCNNKSNVILAYKQTRRSWNRVSRNKLMQKLSSNLQQRSHECTRGKDSLFHKYVGKTGQPHAKGWNWTIVLHHTQKLTQIEFNVRPQIIKLLEENICSKLLNLGLADDFFKIWH